MNEITKEIISGKDVQAIVERGPEYLYNIMAEFTEDVSTLIQAMRNLYEEHNIELSLAGVMITVDVKACKLGEGGMPMLHSEFGSRGLSPASKDDIDEEEAV